MSLFKKKEQSVKTESAFPVKPEDFSKEERLFTFNEIFQIWMEWESMPEVMGQRKKIEVNSKVKGQPNRVFMGVGSIIFSVHFLDYLYAKKAQLLATEKTFSPALDGKPNP